ncbi:thiolase-like protein [Aspergillus desertorum]
MNFPTLPRYDSDLKDLRDLEGMVDLGTTVVIVGYSELGPWGNTRTRWQMESQRRLAQEGYYVGWVDSQSEEPVPDDHIAEKYHAHIQAHAGIRLIEPDVLGGYDPQRKEFLQEIVVEEDLAPFECTQATADAFQAKHGEHVSIRHLQESDTVQVQIKAGARLWIPKIIPLSSSVVAGLLPTGWNAARYGVPDDIIGQVDTVTLYTLCCVAEAFLSAGIENPLEIFTQFHLSEIGNFIGSSLGGTDMNREMFHDVPLDKRVQGDVLQETNLNTPAAWVNMLLLGSSGPIKTPVGACATSLESMNLGIDSILSGKTRMCLVGGVDNLQEDESYAFSTMKATVDATKQFAEGRQPGEFSRPTAESRAGFLEAQGCGVQLICSAETALAMGLPIYAVVAGSTMASDKISRLVPAPGKGLLTFARESPGVSDSPLLDIAYRKEALHASLTLFGLTVDDIGIVSLHGTSTKANDINEPETITTQMAHLGRRGPPLLAICQKSITGHPKAAAAAWMLNGCLQVLHSGLVPGNYNCDNIDPTLEQFEHLAFPTEPMQVGEVKAFLNSFGFGQKGAQMVVVAPKYLFATLGRDCYDNYVRRYSQRIRLADRAFAKALMSGSIVKTHMHPPYRKEEESRVLLDPLSRARIHPDTHEIYFDPSLPHGDSVHTELVQPPSDTWAACVQPTRTSQHEGLSSLSIEAYRVLDRLLRPIATTSYTIGSIGIDIESSSQFTFDANPTFLARNYTCAERDLAKRSLDPHSVYVSRWCAKEAVFKSMRVKSRGAGAAMNAIEICSNENGSPWVKLHGEALFAARDAGITDILLSISYGHDTVIAVAVSHSAASKSSVDVIVSPEPRDALPVAPYFKGPNRHVKEIVLVEE